MVRLGFWQLARLDQRRDRNERQFSQMDAPVLILDAKTLENALKEMEYRKVQVTGIYDFDSQVTLRNAAWNYQIGFDLLTPLLIQGTDTYVLIDRGWIPIEDDTPASWEKYSIEGKVTIDGIIRLDQPLPPLKMAPDPTLAPGQEILLYWNSVNLTRIQEQIPQLFGVFIQEIPTEGDIQPPIPKKYDPDLSEGPHLGYAIQWFLFAAMFLIGYPFFIKNQIKLDQQRSN